MTAIHATPPGPARDVEATLRAVLLRQAGVITRGQAVAAGLSPDTVDRRLATRRWHPVHPRVYRDGDFADGVETRVRATVLWAGPDAVLSGIAAAWWHGLVHGPPAVVGVTVPRRRCPRPRPGTTVRRRELDRVDVATVRGVRVTAPALAVLEAAVELGDRGAEYLEAVLATGTPSASAVRAAHRRTLGAHGSGSAARALDTAARQVRLRARRALPVLVGGVGGWVRGGEVVGLPAELTWSARRLAVRVRDPGTPDDGWWRSVLARQGWSAIELEPGDVLARPGVVLDRLRSVASAADPIRVARLAQ